MRQPLFTGSGVAIITPFTQTGIDFDRLGQLIDWHITEGTDAIIVCGTTGEAPTMPNEEHREAIRYTLERVAKRIPVIAGVGSNDTAHAIANTRYAYQAGVDGILSVVPYYNKTSQQGLYEHFSAIASSCDVPIILYNVPSRTVLNLSPSTIQRLSKLDTIVGLKECNFNQVAQVRYLCGDALDIYSGEDGIVVPLLSLGGKGVISVMANIIPKDTHLLCESFMKGDLTTAQALQIKMTPLIQALFMEPNPVPVKKALELLGKPCGACRLPLVEMEDEHVKVLKEAMIHYGLKLY